MSEQGLWISPEPLTSWRGCEMRKDSRDWFVIFIPKTSYYTSVVENYGIS